MTKITLGERPVRPEGTRALGLTTTLWNSITRCWYANPEDRITISEMLGLLRSGWVISLFPAQNKWFALAYSANQGLGHSHR